MKRLVLLALPLTLANCGYEDSLTAHQAQISLAGMTTTELQSCAGIPDKTNRIDPNTEIFSYVLKNESAGGLDLTLPAIGGLNLGGGSSTCNANIRMVGNRVHSVFYSGNNDRTVGTDGVCAPIFRGCLRRPQPSMTRIAPDAASAFTQPAAPPPPAPPPAPAPAAAETIVRMPTVGR